MASDARLAQPAGLDPRQELSSRGVAQIPRFLGAAMSAELQRVVDEVYSDLAAAKEAQTAAFLADDELGYHFTAWRGVCAQQLAPYLDAARPDLADRWARLVDHVSDQIQMTFGAQWRLIPDRSWLRRHVGAVRAVPWHIDADAAAVAGFGDECFNVWLPLDAVGRYLPSLDVIRGSHTAMRALPLLTAADKYRDDDFASGIGRSSTPVLRPGDALIFDQYTLHRTQQFDSPDIVRTACEFRFAC